MTGSPLPLSGVTVIEFCQVAAGPFCGMLLADLGAELIKIEHPDGGDGLRAWPPLTAGFSENFASLNRNKRSVTLDLKSASGKAAALSLCARADVVIENNRPGVMGRLGLGFDDIRAANPKIVYASISGFGQEGPRANDGGFDVTVQAIAGVMSVTGTPDGDPVKCGVPISDFSTGLYAAFAVAAALRAVAEGAPGRHIDVSLQGATLGVAALQTSEFFGSGKVPQRLGAAHPRNAPYEAFRAKDDWFVMAAGNDKLWHGVCRIIGRLDLATDPRFLTNKDRAQHQGELKLLLETVFGTRDAAHWIDACREAGIPCGRINDYRAALSDPQIEAMGFVQEITLPGGTRTRTFGCPIRLDGETLPIRRNPPALGEHNAEILAGPEHSETDSGTLAEAS